MGAKNSVDPRRLFNDGVAVLLRQAPADRDLHTGVLGLDILQLSERAVEALIGVLAHRAGVEDHQVGLLACTGRDVARVFEHAGKTLGVVHVHLATERTHLVGARIVVLGGARRSHGETV